MLKTLWKYIGKSVLNNFGNKVSTTRIQSYFILGSILTATAVFLGIDIVNAIISWVNNKGSYIIPYEHIVLFGMVLTHHLWLLGINKKAERKNTEVVYKEKMQELMNGNSKAIEEITPEPEVGIEEEEIDGESNQDLPK